MLETPGLNVVHAHKSSLCGVFSFSPWLLQTSPVLLLPGVQFLASVLLLASRLCYTVSSQSPIFLVSCGLQLPGVVGAGVSQLCWQAEVPGQCSPGAAAARLPPDYLLYGQILLAVTPLLATDWCFLLLPWKITVFLSRFLLVCVSSEHSLHMYFASLEESELFEKANSWLTWDWSF